MPSVRLSILCLTLFIASCNQASPVSDAVPASQTNAPAGASTPSRTSGLALPEMTPAEANEIVRDVMNQAYGNHFDVTLGCWTYTTELVNGSHDYCMKPGTPRLVTTKDGVRLYFFAASRADIRGSPAYLYSHSDLGLMGAFVVGIKSALDRPLIAASKEMEFGSAGDCGCANAKFVKFGNDYYGWMFVSGGIWQGVSVLHHNLIAPYRGEFKDLSMIPMVDENTQGTEYHIELDNDAVDNRVLPLLVTKTKPGKKPEKFTIRFDYDKWQYALPKE